MLIKLEGTTATTHGIDLTNPVLVVEENYTSRNPIINIDVRMYKNEDAINTGLESFTVMKDGITQRPRLTLNANEIAPTEIEPMMVTFEKAVKAVVLNTFATFGLTELAEV